MNTPNAKPFDPRIKELIEKGDSILKDMIKVVKQMRTAQKNYFSEKDKEKKKAFLQESIYNAEQLIK